MPAQVDRANNNDDAERQARSRLLGLSDTGSCNYSSH